jgi:hypothetical protein
VGSYDPNSKLAPAGFGAKGYVPDAGSLSYEITFENKSEALAPAREVRVTDKLDPNVDPTTLEVFAIRFAGMELDIPFGLDTYEDLVPFKAGDSNILVQVEAKVSYSDGTFNLLLRALDPATGWYPEDPLVGILYPEDGSGRGQGSICYVVTPRPGLPTGTVITNQAAIVFDYNDPISTETVSNTIDSGAPSSKVAALPALSPRQILVQWSGVDDAGGSGIASYDLYVSRDGGAFQAAVLDLASTNTLFAGTPGHSYSFYTIARDNVGNLESRPLSGQASTLVSTNAPMLATLDNLTAVPGALVLCTNQLASGSASGQFRFSLGSGTPTGASINETNGVFRWIPTCSQASRTYNITVVVVDSVNTNMFDTSTLTISVGECVVPSLGLQVLESGSSGKLPVKLVSTVPLTSLSMSLATDTARLTNLWLEPIMPEICSQSLDTVTNGLIHLSFATCDGQFLVGTQQIAWLHFDTVSNATSAFIQLNFVDTVGQQPDGTPVKNFAPQSGTLVVIGEQPLLQALIDRSGQTSLVLYGKLGWNCRLERTTELSPGGSWNEVLRTNLPDLYTPVTINPPDSRSFYRSVRLPSQ